MKRQTKQRKVIKDLFQRENRPLSVDEILELGRKQVETLNQATVYRNLKILVDDGWLDRITHETIGTLYERADKGHHHHFLCRSCKKTFDLPGCVLDHESAALNGFQVEAHEIYLFGVCSNCLASS